MEVVSVSPFTVTDDGQLVCHDDDGTLTRQDLIDFLQGHRCRIESIVVQSSLHSQQPLDVRIFDVCSESLHTLDLTDMCLREIPTCSFEDWKTLTHVKLPTSIQRIGGRAFRGSGISKIEIPNSVRFIGSFSFAECSNLQDVTFPNQASSLRLGTSVFKRCSSLRTIKLPEGLMEIPEQTFFGCQSLISAHLPRSLKDVGIRAFKSCKALETISLPPSHGTQDILRLGRVAFSECSALLSIHLPTNRKIKYIGNQTFLKCPSLLRIRTIEGSDNDHHHSERKNIHDSNFSRLVRDINAIITSDFHPSQYVPLFDEKGDRKIPEVPNKLWPLWFAQHGEGFVYDNSQEPSSGWWTRMSPLARKSVTFQILRQNIEIVVKQRTTLHDSE